MAIRTILHPTDFSPSARRALTEAVALALAGDATLHLFHAVLLHAEETASERSELDAYAAEARREAARARPGGAEALRLETAATRSIAAFDGIMGAIERLSPDLVVLGTHGRTGVAKLLMGSDAEKVLRHAPGHVLTVRADTPARAAGPLSRLLVPSDFSEPARHALNAARAIARDTGAAITLLHVLPPLHPMYYAGFVSTPFQLDPNLQARVADRLQEWAGSDGLATRVAEGSPGAEIVQVADDEDVDLIVIGTRGLSGLEHVLVGSVTERVCRFATRPVLVVK